MMSKRNESIPDKGKKNFMCCSCFGRKRSSTNFSIIGLSEQNEPYEYIVEKLAIKKVPLSLFATAEDLQKHSKVSDASTPSYVSQRSGKTVITALPVQETKAPVTFSAYYEVNPKPDIERASHTIVPEHETPSITSLHYNEPPEVVCPAIFHRSKSKKVLTDDEEREIVSHILNKHSSLFTLDAKEAVPKDPDHLPTNATVVPPCVQAVLNNPKQELFPPINSKRQIHVDVHRVCEPVQPKLPLFMPPMKYPTSIPQSKKELTPELKQTINALGFAQRPHIPGMPPKNQRSLLEGTICEGVMEKEICCNALGGDHIEETLPQELGCHVELQRRHMICKPGIKKEVTVPKGGLCEGSDCNDHFEPSNLKMEGNVPRFGRNLIVEQCNPLQNNKSISTAPDSCDPIQMLPIQESVATSDPKLEESDQITEISQLKGQSLKWKIIIKHHSDKKDKEGKLISEKSDFSDSDSESKPYLLSNRSLSPHR